MSTNPTAEAFNIVLLYERSDLMGKAMATCSALRRELGHEFTPDFRIWRIDLVTSAEFAAQAERDIAAADVIVIGVCGTQPCPPAFQRWKEGVIPGRGGPHRAIIALVETADEPVPAAETWSSVLRGATTQIHPEIFVWEPRETLRAVAHPPDLDADALVPVADGTLAGVCERV